MGRAFDTIWDGAAARATVRVAISDPLSLASGPIMFGDAVIACIAGKLGFVGVEQRLFHAENGPAKRADGSKLRVIEKFIVYAVA